ncbi:MAG: amidase [Terricaulis sp.]
MSYDMSRRALLASTAATLSLSACNGKGASSDALGDHDATAIAASIAKREISAGEALEAAIVRADRVNPQLNFIATASYEYARGRASAPLTGPFAGVPTLIKDLVDVAGLPTHYGCRAFANNVAREQAPYMDAVLASGIVPFGKSTTPEFGLTATTEPLLGGVTKNPWDIARSCGGSSGGAAVAVAARVIPIAHASDGGGSIRIPASCNGVFGLKPSRGRTINDGRDQGPLPISVNGAVSLSVRDSAQWLAATEQSGEGANLQPVGLVSGPNSQRLRIALSVPDFRDHEPDAEVRAATEAAAQLCRSLGHEVREARPNLNGQQFSDDFILLWAASAAEVVQLVQASAGQTPLDQLLEPLTLDLAQHFARNASTIRDAIGRLMQVEAAYAAFFADVDVLLTPVLARPPLPLGEISPSLGMEVGFARVLDYVGYTPLQNVAGAPAMSIPLGWSQSGLPIGAHFSAAKGQERRLLELAFELEQAKPWADRKPQVSSV